MWDHVSVVIHRLNSEQRRAAEYGAAPGTDGSPLLMVIAGAGIGKTTTLAHRVAHLIVQGSDPGRILLMTFSPNFARRNTCWTWSPI